jgi:hypothetical protein
MADQTQPNINFTLDPNKAPVYSVDSYLISSNNNTVTLNFAQAALDGAQQNIITRVALTPAQARELLSNLNDHIEKFEI